MGRHKKNKRWCDSEKIMLGAVYAYIPTKILAKRFCTSYDSIERQAHRQGLKKDKECVGDSISKAKRKYYDAKRDITYYANDKKMIYAPDHPKANKNGRVPEHILLMEKKLGRYLLEGERVCHKDNDLKNNDLDNLYILQCVTVKSVNQDEIIEKRKAGTSIVDLKKQYNMTTRTLYKILESGGCVKRAAKRKKDENKC